MKSVFIVEDEMINSLHLAQLVKELGYAVCGTAVTGEEAVKKCNRTDPGVILMDILLAGDIDGIDAVRQIHKKKFIPVIYITASTDAVTFERAKKTRMAGYIKKPFFEEELKQMIKDILNGGT